MSKSLRLVVAVLLVSFVTLSAGAVTLTMQVTGSGTTIPAVGTHTYSSGTVVNIWALPADGWKFDHWETAMTGPLNPKTLNLGTTNKTVRAVFVELPPLSPSTALKHFMANVDTNYTWNRYSTKISLGYTTYFIDMISQVWRSANEVDRPNWQHYLIITKGWFTGNTCILLIDGGSNGGTPPTTPDDAIGYMSLLAGFPVADLKQCPNEPLMFADEPGVYRTEDDILAYSFDKYMLTGDYRWNGHLPMAKAALKGMDTIQRQLTSVTKFIIAGASKRGWTTWLTAATDDPRIIGYVPIVIPILNVNAQMKHHWESYGFWAPAVQDYDEFDLFCRAYSPEGVDWLTIEDPYSYLGASTTIAQKPKLLVNACGDQFFMPDSLQFFWNDIPGPGAKHVRILPNASHGMEEGDSFDQALATTVAWATNVKNNAANPSYTWTVNNGVITLTCGSTPSGGAKLWQATNPLTRDFRIEHLGTVWTSSTLTNQGNNTFVASCPPPAQGWTAFFIEVDFGSDHKYTSEITIVPDTLPFLGTECL